MNRRTIISLAGTLAIWAGTTSVALAQDSTSAPGNRMDAVAGRMIRGESYDQATRATLPASRSTMRRGIQVSPTPSLDSYDRVASRARLAASEDADVVNARYEKHLAAMSSLGAHEAGWIASIEK